MIYLSIGSNLISKFGNRFDNIQKSISLISKFATIDKISNFYETPSYPNRRLPKFLNVGVLANSKKDHNQLLEDINLIEKKIGRINTRKNDPRVIDVDIIDFKGIVKGTNRLKLPHPKTHLRNFVLYPIMEIDPKWSHPILKKNAQFLINSLSQKSRIEITRLQKNVNIKL